MSTTPRTDAGRALVDYPLATAGIGSDRDDDRLREAVVSIEGEAIGELREFHRDHCALWQHDGRCGHEADATRGLDQ